MRYDTRALHGHTLYSPSPSFFYCPSGIKVTSVSGSSRVLPSIVGRWQCDEIFDCRHLDKQDQCYQGPCRIDSRGPSMPLKGRRNLDCEEGSRGNLESVCLLVNRLDARC
jgi:hypothetical protein